MLITNYGELKAKVAQWLNRSDLVDDIPTFIQLAENELFRQLRCPGNESHITYIADDGSGLQQPPIYDNRRQISLTEDFQEVKNITYGGQPLTRISDQEYLALMNDPSQAASLDGPRYFARLFTRIHFFPQAVENLDVDLWFYETQGPLGEDPAGDSASTRTLGYAPGLYLFGALLQAQAFLIGDERIPVWQTSYDRLLASVQDQADEAEYAGSTVEVASVYHDGSRR